MKAAAIVTVVTRGYLRFARALVHGVVQVNPDCAPVVVVVDAEGDLPTIPGAEVIDARTFGIPGWEKFAFQYTATELACALKPFAIRELLRRGHRSVLYLDSDIYVYSSLNGVLELLRSSPIVVVPHILEPLPNDGLEPSDHLFVRSGPFNGGSVGVRKCEEGERFVEWWSAWTRKECVYDVANGKVVDQTWLTLIPAIFENHAVCREVGVNVAYWNLSQRPLRRLSDGTFTAAGQPLRFFHFSGFSPENAFRLTSYPSRDAGQACEIVLHLCGSYAAKVRAYGGPVSGQADYGYGVLEDGTPIDPLWRECVRMGLDPVVGLQNPFSTNKAFWHGHEVREAVKLASMSRLDWRLRPEAPRHWLRRLLGK